MLLPVTLSAAAAAALIAVWLATRVLRLRISEKVTHGDGGHALIARRMRAQLNYVEYTPFVLALVALIEIAGKGGNWLAYVSAAYFLARIGHAFGMDGEQVTVLRQIGMAATLFTLIGLAAYAALIAGGVV